MLIAQWLCGPPNFSSSGGHNLVNAVLGMILNVRDHQRKLVTLSHKL